MGNPQKGEVEFTVGKTVYTLHYSINAMCELEDKMGAGIMELASVMSDPAKVSIKTARTMFWAGLKDHHETITEAEAGKLMSALGLAEAIALVGKAFTLAFPEAENTAGPLAKPAAESTGKPH